LVVQEMNEVLGASPGKTIYPDVMGYFLVSSSGFGVWVFWGDFSFYNMLFSLVEVWVVCFF